eukprot:2424411-Ditylum_brightwellii.AAC.1
MGHLVWNVKMDFIRKAQWVLDGHKTVNPIGSTYAGTEQSKCMRRRHKKWISASAVFTEGLHHMWA